MFLNDGELIEQVRQFAFLYDKIDKRHKNETARDNAWQSIAAILGSTAEECEQQWNNLRNRYATELRKMKNMPTGSGGYSQGHLFDAMNFLQPFVTPRRTKGNISQPRPGTLHNIFNSTSQILDESEVYDFERESQSADATLDEVIEIESQALPISLVAREKAPSPVPSTSKGRTLKLSQTPCTSRSEQQKRKFVESTEQLIKKKKTNNELGTALNSAIQSFQSYVQSGDKHEKEDENPDFLFARMIGHYLQNIKDVKKKIKIKIDILSLFE